MAAATLTTHILPGELIEDILARLPVKSLKRFRGVAKFWCSLIQSPQFITAHYSCSKNKTLAVLKRYTHREGKPMVSFISNHTLDVVANFDVPNFDMTPAFPIRIIGCSHGILCLSDYANGILLWNIATREFKSLPICPGQYPPGYRYQINAIGFGYDSKRDDYKVVRIETYYDGESDAPLGYRVALYNLTTNSWRNIDATFKFTRKIVSVINTHFYSNGFYHFGKVSDNEEESLLSFDFIKEVFVTTPYPPDVMAKNDGTIRVFYHMEIDGSVGGVHFDFRTYRYDVWVLGEIGAKNSWTKLFTIGGVYSVELPLQVSINGEFFFKHEDWLGEEYIMRYQRSSKQATTTLQPLGFFLQLAMYAESLVSLKG